MPLSDFVSSLRLSPAIRQGFVACLCVIAFSAFAMFTSQNNVRAQTNSTVPPESALPKTELPDKAFPIGTPSTSPSEPPSEADLPGFNNETDRDNQRAEKPSDIPDESALPDSKNSANGANASALPGGVRPRLRLDLKGHTGIVRALDAKEFHSNGEANAVLVTAGDDKDVHVWQRSKVTKERWVHRRTVRWPIVRGPRGRIYSVALSNPVGHAVRLAMAGHGATGGLGEIWIVDVISGELQRAFVNGGTINNEKQTHRQTIATLRWSPRTSANSAASETLASADVEGQVMLWSRDDASGLWSGRKVIQHDEKNYGSDVAMALRSRRRFVPITFLGPHHLVAAKYVGPAGTDDPQAGGAALWQLQRINLATGQVADIADSRMIEFAVTLDASDDGRVLLSSDAVGQTRRFRFDRDGKLIDSVELKTSGVPLFIKLHADGHGAVIGTTRHESKSGHGGNLQVWDLQPDEPRLLSSKQTEELPLAGTIVSSPVSDTFHQAVVARGNRVEIATVDQDGKLNDSSGQILETRTGTITRVAFAPSEQENDYQIAIARDEGPLTDRFDLTNSRLRSQSVVDENDFLSDQRLPDRWTAKSEATEAGARYRLFQNDTARGLLPIVPELHGAVTSLAAAPLATSDPDRRTLDAVFVGTSGRNEIQVYEASAADPPRWIRQFRGHTGDVTSLSVSSDSLYLASGSTDTTVSLWNLQDISKLQPIQNRWGADFEVNEEHLTVTDVRDEGPLFFRGVRGGDRLLAIRWADETGGVFTESDAEKMLQLLTTLPADTLVVFDFTRMGRPIDSFQSFAAWRPLATLMVDRDREWAYWTPAGFYDASINGHRRIGWQINRGVAALPDFYRADQFREALERPGVMRRLLSAGSLQKAMRQTLSGIGPPPGETAIVSQIKTGPIIRITHPAAGTVVDGDKLTVRATIDVPAGGELLAPKAYCNGIPAVSVTKHAASGESGRDLSVVYQFEFSLPRHRELYLEITAATESRSVARATMELTHTPDAKPKRRPRLHLLAIGVGRYQDPQIQSLDFAARATDVLSDALNQNSGAIYDVSTDRLTDSDATESLWRLYASSATQRLAAEVQPDDVVLMYLCGHGLRDRRTNQWYFVTADAKYSDLMNDRYHDCLSSSDLAVFSQLPCTKIAILDSCHSGAVQNAMRPDDLKSVLRFLQDDVVITWTASEGDQEAAEKRETRLGRFTTHLIDALKGKGDAAQGDDVVSLKDAIAYVSRRVAQESESEGQPQHPTAGPAEWIDRIDIPLTMPVR